MNDIHTKNHRACERHGHRFHCRKMMTAAKQPLVKLQQQKQILEWQEEDYRTLNQKYFDFRSTLSNMKLTTKYRVRTTTSSNENNVTATAANNAALGSATIQSVTQLATAATKISGSGSETATTISKSGAKIKADASLYSQTGNFLNGITWNNGVRSPSLFRRRGCDGIGQTVQSACFNHDGRYYLLCYECEGQWQNLSGCK